MGYWVTVGYGSRHVVKWCPFILQNSQCLNLCQIGYWGTTLHLAEMYKSRSMYVYIFSFKNGFDFGKKKIYIYILCSCVDFGFFELIHNI